MFNRSKSIKNGKSLMKSHSQAKSNKHSLTSSQANYSHINPHKQSVQISGNSLNKSQGHYATYSKGYLNASSNSGIANQRKGNLSTNKRVNSRKMIGNNTVDGSHNRSYSINNNNNNNNNSMNYSKINRIKQELNFSTVNNTSISNKNNLNNNISSSNYISGNNKRKKILTVNTNNDFVIDLTLNNNNNNNNTHTDYPNAISNSNYITYTDNTHNTSTKNITTIMNKYNNNNEEHPLRFFNTNTNSTNTFYDISHSTQGKASFYKHLESKLEDKINQNKSSKSHKYNSTRSIFDEYIKTASPESQCLLMKLLKNYHETILAFSNENKMLRERNELIQNRSLDLERENIQLRNAIQEKEKEIEGIKKKNTRTKSDVASFSRSTNESLVLSSGAHNKSNSNTKMQMHSYQIQQLQMKQNTNVNVNELDDVNFIDVNNKQSKCNNKCGSNVNVVVPPLKLVDLDELTFPDKVQMESEKGVVVDNLGEKVPSLNI